MTKVRSITDIASLYESVRAKHSEVVEEKAQKFPKGTFPQSTKEVKATTDFENSGPNKSLKDSDKKFKAKKKKNNKKVKNSGKIVTDSINSFMKSEFDKLFENVMGDDESAFDVTPTMGPEGSEADVDATAETEGGEDEVTITLSKELAQQLHDVLMGVLEVEGEMGDEDSDLEDLGIDLEGEDEGGMGDEDENLNDSTEISELGDKSASLKGKNNKVHMPISPKGGKADAKVTDEVGTKVEGHPMDKESSLTKSDNKVHSTKTNKPGAHLFA
jgi:hypothetical protein